MAAEARAAVDVRETKRLAIWTLSQSAKEGHGGRREREEKGESTDITHSSVPLELLRYVLPAFCSFFLSDLMVGLVTGGISAA